MERKTNLDVAGEIMGRNFIGPQQLLSIAGRLGLTGNSEDYKGTPDINFSVEYLQEHSEDSILILGIPKFKTGDHITINLLRSLFGTNPQVSEPCFYNQDWYLGEDFATREYPEHRWYMLTKFVFESSRGSLPEDFLSNHGIKIELPSAVLCTFSFFAYYFINNGEKLWDSDFIWTDNYDRYGDQIYVGRYSDPMNTSRNGFNIHRHLKIKSNYGVINCRKSLL